MSTLSRCRLLAAVAAVSFMAGCGRSPEPAAISPATTATSTTAAFASPPWLRQHLPEDTVAYLRLPSLWGLLSAPNQRGADAMYGNPAHEKVIAQLRQALAGNAVTADILGSDSADRVLRALSSVQAPIEIAFTAPGKVASPAAMALVSTAFDTRDPEPVSALLGSVFAGAGFPPLRFESDGFALATSASGASAAAHFDRESGRLNLLVGMGAAREPLQSMLDRARRDGPRPHAMHALEQEIDAGGQGLLMWLDMQSVKPYLIASLTPETLPLRHVAEQSEAVALGWGGVNGHGRLGLRVQLKDPTWMRYLPQAPRRFNLHSVGEPVSVVTLALPDSEDMDRMLAAVGDDYGPDVVQRWEEFEDAARKKTGLSVREWLAPFSNELVLFDDDAGGFSAVRLRDREALRANIGRLTAQGSEYTVRTVGGVDIHYLRLRWPAGEATQAGGSAGAALLDWWGSQPMHLYWIEEGDWQIHSAVPQPLIDRIAMTARQPIDAWLRERHGDDRSQALASVSTRVEGMPRQVYRYYLGLLALLGDFTNSPVDLFALPSARQLALPERTGVGLQLLAGPERAGLDLNYQSTPLDGLLSGSGAYGSFAVVAILVSIAVPAYQDYVTRSRVVEAVAATRPLQKAIIEHYAAHGGIPAEQALAEQIPLASDMGDTSVHVERDGRIVIGFNERAASRLRELQLVLRPFRTPAGDLLYVCGLAQPPSGARPLGAALDAATATTLHPSTLPAHCRARN